MITIGLPDHFHQWEVEEYPSSHSKDPLLDRRLRGQEESNVETSEGRHSAEEVHQQRHLHRQPWAQQHCKVPFQTDKDKDKPVSAQTGMSPNPRTSYDLLRPPTHLMGDLVAEDGHGGRHARLSRGGKGCAHNQPVCKVMKAVSHNHHQSQQGKTLSWGHKGSLCGSSSSLDWDNEPAGN